MKTTSEWHKAAASKQKELKLKGKHRCHLQNTVYVILQIVSLIASQARNLKSDKCNRPSGHN